jgi:hypothetical protein
MPKKKSNSSRSRTKRGQNISKLVVLPKLVSDKALVTLPWIKMGLDGTSAPGFAVRTYVVNDIYNIDSAGVSTSRPQMYDQFAAIYQNFKVISVRIKSVMSISDGYRHLAALAPRRVSSAPANIAQAVLRKGSKWGGITMYEHLILTGGWRLGDIAGPAYADSDFTGQYATSPVKTVALDLASAPINTGAATSLQYIDYLEFEVMWSQRRNVANA